MTKTSPNKGDPFFIHDYTSYLKVTMAPILEDGHSLSGTI